MGTETEVKPEVKPGETPVVTPGKGTEGAKAPTVEELQKQLADQQEHNKKLQDENAKRRNDVKSAKEVADKAKAALKALTGEDDTPDPQALEKKRTQNTMRNLHLKSAFVSATAREMHDADFAYDAVAKDLADVEVNLDTGAVDKATLGTKIADLKKSKPFLFMSDNKGSNVVTPNPKGNPDGGQPTGTAGGAYKTWRDLNDAGRRAEAVKFYAENKPAINASWPADVKFPMQ